MTDINARMSAWHDASQHPERAGEFLRGYHVVNDRAVDAVKDSISPNGEIKESANETDPKEFMPAMADAAEEVIDDDEAGGRLYKRDTAEERGDAVAQHVGDPKDIVADSEAAGRDMPMGWEGHVYGVDFASYLESLMDKGKITPEQYVQARRSFNLGRDSRRI